MTLFSIDRRATHRRQKHSLLDPMYAGTGRVLFKGQLFLSPMDWMGILQQLKKLEEDSALISLPVPGAVLAGRVRVTIAAGLVDLNKLLRQATVRRNVVEQLIRMGRDAGHPDYQHVDMHDVRRRSRELATSDEPAIPSGLVEFLNAEDEVAKEFFAGVDKAATPAERAYTVADLQRNLNRARPQTLVPQRDSDANRDVLASRDSALSRFSILQLKTGADLEKQFKSEYIPRVFCTTFPRVVGGPDFPGGSSGAERMMPSRCPWTSTPP